MTTLLAFGDFTSAGAQSLGAGDVPVLLSACHQGHMDACLVLGTFYLEGNRVEADAAEAFRLFTIACEGGSSEACAAMSMLLELGVGVEQDMARAAQLAQLSCEAGSLAGCTRLGSMILKGEGTSADLAEAAGFLELGCQGGYPLACVYLAELAASGELGVVPVGDVRALLRRACDGTEDVGCGLLAIALLVEPVAQSDLEEAFSLLESACSADDLDACSYLAMLHQIGRHVTADSQRARELYSSACSGGHGAACLQLALLIAEQDLDLRQAALLQRLANDACRLGDLDGCGLLTLLALTGRHGDQTATPTPASQGCQSGGGAACNLLGVMYELGIGVETDQERAAELFIASCEASHDLGCLNGLRLAAHGSSVSALRLRDSGAWPSEASPDLRLFARVAFLVGYDDRHLDQLVSALLVEACESRDAWSCGSLGVRHLHGLGVERHQERGLQLLLEACRAGDHPACMTASNLGANFLMGVEVGLDAAQVRRLLEGACSHGYGLGCVNLGNFHAQGLSGQSDQVRASQLYQQACQAGTPSGCQNLGLAFLSGAGVEQDPQRGLTLLEQACELGESLACLDLGRILLQPEFGPELELAQQHFERVCTEQLEWCAYIAGGLLGEGEEQDISAALLLYQVTCELGRASSCLALGLLASLPPGGIVADLEAAARWFERACQGGDLNGCVFWGSCLEEGRGIELDPERAAELYLQACEAGLALACRLLAVLHQEGRGVEQDEQRADELLQRGQSLENEGERERPAMTREPAVDDLAP